MPDHLGSAYIPVDSWVYPAMTRLYSLGYVDTMFLGMRPWTRRSALHMLQESQDAILSGESQEAQDILASMLQELSLESLDRTIPRGKVYGLQSVYTRLMGIGGQTLRDSYHLGQTISNDYGRPYQSGFNNLTGFSTLNEWGRFSLFTLHRTLRRTRFLQGLSRQKILFGLSRQHCRFICWDMRFREANRTHG